MKTIKHIYTEIDHRPPKKGELYLGDYNTTSIACTDHSPCESRSHPILTYEKIEEDWKPKDGKNYYFINSTFNVSVEKCITPTQYPTNILTERFRNGNCFPTRELAEQKLKQIKEILK